MKKNLKLLISFLVIVLIFAPQATYSMENFKNMVNATVDNVRCLFAHGTSSKHDIAEESKQKKRKEEIQENPFPFERFIEEIKFNILECAAIDNYLSGGNTGSLRLVCKEWDGIINKDFMNRAILSAYELLGYGEIYRRFLKGVLIYRPQMGSDIGRIDLPIAALSNPLEGTFDLSQCLGAESYFEGMDICFNSNVPADKYISISTGYRKRKLSENANKVNTWNIWEVDIWLTPRFLIEKEINGNARHFKEIFPDQWSETAPIGIFWTWESNDLKRYDYCTNQPMNVIENGNLDEKWRLSPVNNSANRSVNHIEVLRRFSCSFPEERQGQAVVHK